MIEGYSVLEAVESLSGIAELTAERLKKYQGSAKKEKGFPWLNFESKEYTLEKIKEIFGVLGAYCKEIVKNKAKLKDGSTEQGIHSMIQLAKEAATVLNRHKHLWDSGLKDPNIHALKEYQELLEIYEKKFSKKKSLELKKAWSEKIGNESIELESREIKELEAIKQDLHYELLCLQKEDGKRFFNRDLLRHLKLVHDFERLLVVEYAEDPFLKMRKIQDVEIFASSKEIKGEMLPFTSHLVEEKASLDSEFYRNLSFSVYALLLATSHHNLSEKGGKKDCLSYFRDFGGYLSKSFTSSDYQVYSHTPWLDLDVSIQNKILLAYDLCLRFFVHSGTRDQMMGFIKTLMNPQDFPVPQHKKGASPLWGALVSYYKYAEEKLKNYPNGPLFKALDDLVDPAKNGFNPLEQENYPRTLYCTHNERFKTNILRMPSPTQQVSIHKAEISPLFETFIVALRQLKNGQNFLLINLQDRTSWQEHARCQALENLPSQPHIVEALEVCTFAKKTPFYHQTEEYQDESSAKEFKEELQEQILQAEAYGFYFSKNMEEKYLKTFAKECIALIHEHFFAKKGVLSRRNRQDFVEIFYFFLTLKLLDTLQPTQTSFTCKDGVDTGAMASAGFFGFIKLFSEDFTWSLEEEDFFLWMCFSSALQLRERLVGVEEYERVLNALETLDMALSLHRKEIIKAFEALYGYRIFKNLSVQEKTA